jgi:uncharacterized membrane protein
MEEHSETGLIERLLGWIEIAAVGIELLAVIIIIGVALASTLIFLWRFFTGSRPLEIYNHYKVLLGRGLLLGLEMLVAADIVRTVALEPNLSNVAALGLLVLIRTFLSWSLVVEIEHRWPWQRPVAEEKHE